MDEEDIIDDPLVIEEPEHDLQNSSDSDDEPIDINEEIIDDIEDINVFTKNYSKLLKENKSTNVLSKYEKTKILSKRCEQLESGCLPLIKDYENFDNIYDIALEELNEKKIPFILKRFINGKYEYWKLEDLIY
jgi:DNA-directed RNA polymerases I, II, and III subunit RPABC2